jgi:hypothetical protein
VTVGDEMSEQDFPDGVRPGDVKSWTLGLQARDLFVKPDEQVHRKPDRNLRLGKTTLWSWGSCDLPCSHALPFDAMHDITHQVQCPTTHFS